MRTWQAVIVGFVAAACADERGGFTVLDDTPAVPDDVGTDTAPPVPSGCENPLLLLDPPDGSTASDPARRPSVRLASADPEVRIRLRRGQVDVPGTTEVEGAIATFVPAVPIQAGTEHELRASWACGSSLSRFTPRERTWRVEPQLGTLVRPALQGERAEIYRALLAPYWLGLAGVSRDQATWILAPAVGVLQEACVPSVALAGALDVDGLGFQARSVSGVMQSSAAVLPVRSLVLSGARDAPEGTLGKLAVEANVDLRPAAPALPGGPSIEGVCSKLPAGCSRCPDGAIGCVTLAWEDVPTREDGPPLVVRTPTDIGTDPACR